MNAPDPAAEAEPFDHEVFCADPSVRNSASAKIMILRGPIYADDSAWSALLRYEREVERFLAEIGARLVLNKHDGYAFADQAPDGEPGSDWPKLFYRDRFSFEVTCVLLVLREWLLRRESVPSDEHAPLKAEDLLHQLRTFSRKNNVNVEREEKRWREAINKVVGYGFMKRVRSDEEAYIVRPIVRAKLSLDTLQDLRVALERSASGPAAKEEDVA